MREIKFRAWHKPSKYMINWEDLSELMNGKEMVISEGNTAYKIRTVGFEPEIQGIAKFWRLRRNLFTDKDLILCQFTNLHDKNGKEIYEGDIVRNLEGKICVVKWDTYFFRFGEYPDIATDGKEVLNFEVVGNTYENPELLEEK